MLRGSFALVLLLLGGCAEGTAHLGAPGAAIEVSEVVLDPEQAREVINRYRASKGMKPLTLNARLTEAARGHSADLARLDRISHKGSDGSNPWNRVEQAGYKPKLTAENVGAGQRSLAEVVHGWQESKGHDRNLLLPDATQMGIALVKNPASSYGTFWTLVLASPM